MTTPPGRKEVGAEALLRALGHAVIATDPEGRIVAWNPEAERLYGWTAEEVLGRVIAEVTVPEGGQELAAEIMAALRQGRPWSGAFRVRRRDGSTFPALVTDTGIVDDDGVLVGIVGVSLDLGHALRPVLARSSDAVVMISRTGAVTFVSPAATALLGWNGEEFSGRTLWDLVHPEDREEALDRFRALREGRTPPTATLECRVRCGGEEESYRWVEMVMTDLLDDPAVRGVVCNLRDVTERRADRDRLAELSQQLQQALTTRVVIEQAKGMVAGQRGIGLDEAFRLLRRHARDHNATLQAVASAVVTVGLRL